MSFLESLGYATLVLAFGMMLFAKDCRTTFEDCDKVCGSGNVVRVEITSNHATCECAPATEGPNE